MLRTGAVCAVWEPEPYGSRVRRIGAVWEPSGAICDSDGAIWEPHAPYGTRVRCEGAV
jgi:hypothetical protein